MSDKVIHQFFRHSIYDEMVDKLEGVLNNYAKLGVSRCEVVGCLEFMKHRILHEYDDEDS